MTLESIDAEADTTGGHGSALADRAYRVLEERIVTLALAPGAVLSEATLAADLGMEGTPVRAALRRLEREGLVCMSEGDGPRVSDIDAMSQLRLLEVRRRVEGLTAALAARRATPEQRERFRALDRSFREVVSHEDEIVFLRLDRALNQLLPEAAHNPYCAPMMAMIEGLARRFFYRNRAALDLGLTARLHARIAAAVADGGEVEAEAAVMALLDYNERFALGSLRRA